LNSPHALYGDSAGSLARPRVAANGEHSLFGSYFNSLRIDARQIDVQYELIRFLVDVHGRQPRARIGSRGQRGAK
jgi:hypothetical protein